VDVTPEDFRRYYESLSDEALLEIDLDELTPIARTCHSQEVKRRGLGEEEPDVERSAGGEASSGGGSQRPAEEEFVSIVEYDYHEEADVARGLLESAGIPASIQNEPGVVHLMVPSAFAEQALGMLAATPISEEELAAQAEAAGLEEDEAEDDDEEAADEESEA
jgi:hypothetical protein